MRTGIEPEVVADNRIETENIFFFKNDNKVLNAEADYLRLTLNQEKLVEDKDLWMLEKNIGILKKACVKWKQKNMKLQANEEQAKVCNDNFKDLENMVYTIISSEESLKDINESGI